MTDDLHFLIIDGYPKKSRDELQEAGMTLAWELYLKLLRQHAKEATYDLLLPSDPAAGMPSLKDLEAYSGIIWTGCNLTVFDTGNASVSSQIELAKKAYEVGVPSFGSCWGLQIAVVAAGGKVEANPRGREMGLARKIFLNQSAAGHQMFTGKPPVFDALTSHDDMVTQMPANGTVLAGNSFTHIQAAEIIHKKGTFWATQYHPEYDLREMARLIVAREKKLIKADFFKSHDEMITLVRQMEALFENPENKSLRWQLAIDDDILSDSIRQCEFANWINKLVLPMAEK